MRISNKALAFVGAPVLVLAMSASSAFAKEHHKDNDKVGKGAFLVFVYHPDRLAALYPERKPIEFQQVNTRDIDGLNIVNADCNVQEKAQRPSWWKVVLYTAGRNTPGALVTGTLGALAGGFVPKGAVVSAKGYGLNTGIVTAGGSIGAGITGYEVGKHNAVAGCVAGILPKAQSDKYINRNIVVTYNSWTVYSKPIKRSSFPDPVADESSQQPAAAAPAAATDQTPPPPPPGQ